MEIKIGGKYKVCTKLGSGSYGDIFQGINIKTNEEIGIKLEKLTAETPMLIYEAQIIKKFVDIPGFPNIHWSGV
jgi:serine/threonine protein kinase